jgi:cation diffusion facilitator family transporter
MTTYEDNADGGAQVHDTVHGHTHADVHHGHDHGPAGHRHDRRTGALVELFRGHSHDATDSMDSALEASERGVRAVKISFVALLLTSAAQVLIVAATGSVALLADTIHNFSDALTAVPLFIAFRLSRRPANRRYTYGYRRAEDLAGLFVIAMITLSALVAAYEAIRRVIHPQPLDNVGWLFAAGLVGFVGNELVALYRIRVGEQVGSAALAADGHHARTDGFTSLAVALGSIGVWLGFDRADPIVGVVISIAILAVLLGAARQVFYRLMDAVDPAIVEDFERVVASTPGVKRVEPARVRWAGHRLEATVAIVVDDDLSVRDGHAVAEEARHNLLHAVRHLDDVEVHVDPDTADGDDPHALTAHHG